MLDIETFPPQDKQNCRGTAQQENWDLRFKIGVRGTSNSVGVSNNKTQYLHRGSDCMTLDFNALVVL